MNQHVDHPHHATLAALEVCRITQRLATAGDSRPEWRQRVEATLARADELHHQRALCRVFPKAAGAIDTLLAAGLPDLPSRDRLESAFFTLCDAETRLVVEQEIGRAIRTWVEQEVQPIARAIATTVVEDLRGDLAELREFSARFAGRNYGAPATGTLDRGIEIAVAHLEKQIAAPLDMSWHCDLRGALAHLFSRPLAPSAADTPVAAPPSAAEQNPAVPSLRSAAEVAAARAA